MKAILTLHIAADVDIGVPTTPCARCRGRTFLVAVAPGGPWVQVDLLDVEWTGDPEVRLRLDVAAHDCARWGEAQLAARKAVLAQLDRAKAREASATVPAEGGGA